jgi:hypothetical protein
MSIQYGEGQNEPIGIGSNVYGGRPTFALVRDEGGEDVTLTLFELLPTQQADARRRRLERRKQQTSKALPFDKVINDTDGIEDWRWDDWVAVKVRRLSGVHLRSILQLLDETLRKADVDPSISTGTGESTLLVQEPPGIRLSLGFIGIKPLQRVDRMRELSRGIASMSLEECYYWYSKCRSPKHPSGAKALRTLLTTR